MHKLFSSRLGAVVLATLVAGSPVAAQAHWHDGGGGWHGGWRGGGWNGGSFLGGTLLGLGVGAVIAGGYPRVYAPPPVYVAPPPPVYVAPPPPVYVAPPPPVYYAPPPGYYAPGY